MRKTSVLVISFLLVAVLTGYILAAKDTEKITFHQRGVVNGVYLKPGTYQVKLNGDNIVEIFRGKELLVSVQVKVEPLGRSIPKSISQKKDGTVKEIRLAKERLVILQPEG